MIKEIFLNILCGGREMTSTNSSFHCFIMLSDKHDITNFSVEILYFVSFDITSSIVIISPSLSLSLTDKIVMKFLFFPFSDTMMGIVYCRQVFCC